MDETFSFENLRAYQTTKQLIKMVYKAITNFPAHERFALSQQPQRAIISVASNIAEGSGRISTKEKIHFLEITYGSLMEAYCQIDLAEELGYVSKIDKVHLSNEFYVTARLISGLRKKFIEQGSTTPNP